MRELNESGFVLLRGAIPAGTIARYRDELDALYAGTDGNGDIPSTDFTAKAGLKFEALFDQPELRHVARASLGRHYVPMNGTMLSVSLHARNAMPGISLHTDGLIQGSDRTVLVFWAPLHECGIEAPGLALVRAGRDDVLGHLRQHFPDRAIPGWHSSTEWNDSPAFRLETIRERFGEPSTPVLQPGDVIAFTNWTIHGSHVTPQMTGKRSAAVIRFIGISAMRALRAQIRSLVPNWGAQSGR